MKSTFVRFAAKTARVNLLAAAALSLLAGAAMSATPKEWVKGRVIIQTRAGLSDAEVGKLANAHGGKAKRIGKTDLHIVDLPTGAAETAVLKALSNNPHVKFAELDGLVRPNLTSNDPYLGSEWHLNKIGAPSAWDTSQGKGITVAIIDTGVDASHPDLAPRLVPGWNFYSNTSDTSDAYNHGTGVAGAAAAIINNGAGVAGVAGQASIMPLRISDASGLGSWSAMAQALTYAADNGARVANISYMVGDVSSVQSAAQYMKNKGGLVFVSAGNTGAEWVATPTTSLIVVGATDGNDARASWSTYGAYVSITAPGVGIFTTTKGGGYVSENGTSFSSPVAAGVAAAVMGAKPTLSSSQVESILFASAVDLGAAGRDPYFGYGRVNADAAIKLALGTTVVDTQAPSAAIAAPLASTTVSGLVPVDVKVADNVGVTRVDLKVNGNMVATDLSGPFAFSWDSSKVPNGSASLAIVAYDAAGNAATSASVVVNVANGVPPDTTPPTVGFSSPSNGSSISGTVSVVASASDNAGLSGLTQTLSIDGATVASGTGGKLSYNWNTRKATLGAHTLVVTAVDAAGNKSSQSMSVTVSR